MNSRCTRVYLVIACIVGWASFAPGRLHAQEAPTPAADRVKVQLTRQAIREKARVLIDTGQPDTAIRHLNAVLAKFPNDEEAFYLIGRAHEARREIPLALANYEKAKTVRDAYSAMARVLRETVKDPVAAEKAVDEGLARFPDYVPLLNEKVVLLISRGVNDKAEPIARRVLTMPTGDTVPNRFYLAQSLFGQRKFDEAESYFRPIAEQTERKRYAAAAREYLEAIEFEKSQIEIGKKPPQQGGGAPSKPYSFRIRLRGEYDSNVALYPDGEKVNIGGSQKDPDDYRLVAELGGSVKFAEGDGRAFGISGNVYNGTLFRLTEFQAMALGGGFFAQFNGGRGVGEWLLRSSLDTSFTFFGKYGSDPDGPAAKQFREFGLFSQTYGLNTQGLYRMSEQWMLNGYLAGSYTRFASDSTARTGFSFGLGGGPSYETSAGVGGLRVGVGTLLKYRSTKSDDYSMFSAGAGLNLLYRLVKGVDLLGGTVFDHRNHFASSVGDAAGGNYSVKRKDNNLIFYTGTEWLVVDRQDFKGSLNLTYTGERNFSNNKVSPNLKYTKHLISLGFGVQL